MHFKNIFNLVNTTSMHEYLIQNFPVKLCIDSIIYIYIYYDKKTM